MAQTHSPKRTLASNYTLDYHTLPQAANEFSEIFTNAEIYGRLRTNWFFYQYNTDGNLLEDHNILGVGGNLVYKTAPYAGISGTVGMYYTSAGTGLDNQPSSLAAIRGGKDTISRYNAINGQGKSFAVLAQSYLQYDYEYMRVKGGRMIFESFFTKSNDSKMIPNTFEGVSLETRKLGKSQVKVGYLTQQKLRDHDNFHSVIMYDDRQDSQSGVINAKWNENDDSGVHRGLSYTNFDKSGQDKNPGMVVVDAKTRLLNDKLKISASGIYLRNLFYTGMFEANYGIELGNGYTLTPGVRYVQQFDDGAGAIGGASLTGLAASDANGGLDVIRSSYDNPESVDTHMTALKLVLDKGPVSLMVAYSDVADKADFIAPWRGFITGGYTREMTRVNWLANTETYDIRGSLDFDEANVISGMNGFLAFAHEDYDGGIARALQDSGEKFASDANVYYFGLIKDLESVPNLSTRFRAEYVQNSVKALQDHSELRLEFNYLF